MPDRVVHPFAGERACLATMHGKERVIAPLLRRFLDVDVVVPPSFDTDAYGTFTREIPRPGSQLDTARAKVAAAFDRDHVALALASEGSFGPHPYLPFCALDREVVILRDRQRDWELIGHHATPTTNFAHAVVSTVERGRAFARRVGFPNHGVIITGCRDGKPASDLGLEKEARTVKTLEDAVMATIARCGSAFLETDMRAHRNPTRMRAIRRATVDLIRKVHALCPRCARPGFAVTERVSGLPCGWCGSPTLLTRAEVSSCAGCSYQSTRPSTHATAEPGHCPVCNP